MQIVTCEMESLENLVLCRCVDEIMKHPQIDQQEHSPTIIRSKGFRRRGLCSTKRPPFHLPPSEFFLVETVEVGPSLWPETQMFCLTMKSSLEIL
jgi:hypothetical protein